MAPRLQYRSHMKSEHNGNMLVSECLELPRVGCQARAQRGCNSNLKRVLIIGKQYLAQTNDDYTEEP